MALFLKLYCRPLKRDLAVSAGRGIVPAEWLAGSRVCVRRAAVARVSLGAE